VKRQLSGGDPGQLTDLAFQGETVGGSIPPSHSTADLYDDLAVGCRAQHLMIKHGQRTYREYAGAESLPATSHKSTPVGHLRHHPHRR
jgi:hypothetical protein